MAELKCTKSEFHRYIGPRIRNVIQFMTKKRKKQLNFVCQKCGKRRELEASHIKGRERKVIIDSILDSCMTLKENGIIKVNLSEIEKKVISSHLPIDKYFLFLCSECHKKYDTAYIVKHKN